MKKYLYQPIRVHMSGHIGRAISDQDVLGRFCHGVEGTAGTLCKMKVEQQKYSKKNNNPTCFSFMDPQKGLK